MATTKYNKLAGKHVLLVAGTSGIGYAVAEACIEHGARVTVSSSRAASVTTALERLAHSYPAAQIAGYTCDLSRPATVEADVQALFDYVSNPAATDIYT